MNGLSETRSNEGLRVAALHSLAHLPVNGEYLVIRTLRLAPDHEDQ